MNGHCEPRNGVLLLGLVSEVVLPEALEQVAAVAALPMVRVRVRVRVGGLGLGLGLGL